VIKGKQAAGAVKAPRGVYIRETYIIYSPLEGTNDDFVLLLLLSLCQ
jgi:hypothetical protein